jgi:hypothetical protein
MKDGHIDAQGTYKELMGAGGAFAEFINEHSNYQEGEEEETEEDEKTIDQVPMYQNSISVFADNHWAQKSRVFNLTSLPTHILWDHLIDVPLTYDLASLVNIRLSPKGNRYRPRKAFPTYD